MTTGMRNDNNMGEQIRRQIRLRYRVTISLFLVPVAAILWNVVQTQFVEGKAWRELARKQRRENVEVAPNRGNIYSRDGQLMASTVPSYALYMDFQAVKPDTFFHYLNPLCNRLAEFLGDKSSSAYRNHLMKGYQKRSREYLITSKRVSHTELRAIQTFPLFKKGRNQSGLYQKKYLKREKPFGSLASRTIGDIYGENTKDGRIGKNGLEMHYDSLLRGDKGLCVRQKVAGEYISVITQAPKDGLDLITTLDIYLQDIVEASLRRELSRINAVSGTVVLMKVKTGEVLAISNLAVADSGVYRESQNFAISDQSEPGSTFKTFSMMVALEDGLVHPDDSVQTGSGRMPMYGRTMTDHNWDKGGYHMLTAARSIWFSSNIGISTLIDKHYHTNPSRFVDGLYRMGLNKPMDLEIPGGGKPRIPHPKDKHRYWAKTDLPWMSIGYVTQMPPIYTLAFYNAIANDGKLMKPYFVKALSKDGADVKTFEPTVVNEAICSKKTLVEIRRMLDSVVVHGTGKNIMSPVVPIAGKTGTAQLSKGAAGYQSGGKSHQVSFCGYFPADHPEYSAIVVIRQPRSELPSGGRQAGGVFKDIAERICAREWRVKPGARSDSLPSIQPPVMYGQASLTKRVLRHFDIPQTEANKPSSDWVGVKNTGKRVELTYLDMADRLVPDVRRMGARDAAYLLGSRGLSVNLSGKGRVVSQSISPGSLYNKGQTITLHLE
jgi:cell division protein FtsI (penicillin-binding protein 3)